MSHSMTLNLKMIPLENELIFPRHLHNISYQTPQKEKKGNKTWTLPQAGNLLRPV